MSLMIKPFFLHPSAIYAHGRELSLPWLERLSLLAVDTPIRLPWHSHCEIEVILCLRGNLCYEFHDHRAVQVPAGFHIIIPPGVEHRTIEGIDEPNLRLSLFLQKWQASITSLSSITKADTRRHYESLRLQAMTSLKTDNIANALAMQIASMIKRGAKHRPNERALLRTLACFILLSLGKGLNQVYANADNQRIIAEAVSWLERHTAEKVSLQQLCSFMGYGRSQLSMLFKQSYGMSPISWLIRHRVEKAKSMLKNSQEPIINIAKATGFVDVAFFARTFKRHTGLSPTRYRESRRNS